MRSRVVHEIYSDLTSSKCISALALGLVMGVLLVVVEVSFAAMIFSGPLSGFATRGAGLLLFGAVALGSILALTGSFRATICTPQDAPVAVLASSTAGIVAALSTTTMDASIATMIAIMALSAILCGVILFLVGHFQLSNLFRFMPYPVIGGFLAGTGWYLLIGAIGVMTGLSANFTNLPELLTTNQIWHWAPGVIYATSLWLVMKRWSHFLVLPGSILAMIALYYVAFAVLGISVDSARETNILLSGVPTEGLWPVFSLSDIQHVRWDVVIVQAPVMGTVILVTLLGLLLNVSGLEVGGGQEMDFNREFRFAGIANVIGGLGGSAPGSQILSLSLLCKKTGADTRLAGLFTTSVLAFVLFLGGGILEYVPLSVLGGLLFFLGLDILDTWLGDARKKLPTSDYGLLCVIFVIIAAAGFLEGVAAGLVITIVMFVIRFSKVDVIANQFDGKQTRSRKTRSVPHRTLLHKYGNRIQGFDLNGYMFFGSATRLGETLKTTLNQDPRPHSILLHFRDVSGFDVSAANAFQRFILAAHTAEVTVVLANMDTTFQHTLFRILPAEDTAKLIIAEDVDYGLEVCEDALIAHVSQAQGSQDSLFAESVDDMMAQLDRQAAFEDLIERLTPWLEEQHYATGTSLIRKNEAQDGLHLLTWGTATAKQDGDQGRLAQYSAGDVLLPQAAFAPTTAPQQVDADTDCRTMLLTRSARKQLETDNAALALKLNQYIIGVMA